MAASMAPVIVGADGSASSLSAARVAARLASLYGLPVQVVHAFNWQPHTPGPVDTHAGTPVGDLVERAVDVVHGVAPGVAVSSAYLEGTPSVTLLRRARTAALLAVGDGELSAHLCLPTHASAVRIAARAFCSVLVARAALPPGDCVVVGVNGSSASERALDFAFDTAGRSGADLVVLRAGGSATEADRKPDDRLCELNDLVAAREEKHHIRARIRLVPGDPAAALVAESENAGLLVIGARGWQPYGGLLGSVAQTLLHHGHAPLVLVRGLLTRSGPLGPIGEFPGAAAALPDDRRGAVETCPAT